MGLIVSIIVATLLERTYGSSAARALVYNAPWFEILWIWFSVTLFVNLVHFKLWQKKKWEMVLFPFAFSVILLGAIMTKHFAVEDFLYLREGESSNQFGVKPFHLPFSLRLVDFSVERYKDSNEPSQFRSDVVIEDTKHNIEKPYSIYMNHILRYRGYRVYQYSFDRDEKGSIFFVSRDPGTPVAYAGFLLLIGVIALAFFHPKSRIRELENEIRKSGRFCSNVILLCLVGIMCLISLVFHVQVEKLCQHLSILEQLGKWLVLVAAIFLLISVMRFVFQDRFKKIFPVVEKIFQWAVWLGFLVFTIGLNVRWISAGHTSWSIKYESMIFSAWASLFAGIALSRHSRLPMLFGSFLSGIVLIMSHMPSINYSVSPLHPILKSRWFVIHVSTAIVSYGFFAIGIAVAFLSLLALAFNISGKENRFLRKLPPWSKITEQALWIGLLFLSIGTILGSVWANETWGQYWGWDPKEAWTLIVILSYSLVLHLRFLLRSHWIYWFNVWVFPAFGTLLMTYIGVNIFFSGMHTYGREGGSQFPLMVFLFIGIWIALSLLAYRNRQRI